MKQQVASQAAKTNRFGFLRDTFAELKKVVWLSRREAAYLTILVIIVSIAVGIILGVLDYGFTFLMNRIFIGG